MKVGQTYDMQRCLSVFSGNYLVQAFCSKVKDLGFLVCTRHNDKKVVKEIVVATLTCMCVITRYNNYFKLAINAAIF